MEVQGSARIKENLINADLNFSNYFWQDLIVSILDLF